jgi:DNA-binding transcriptional MerR regulator
MKAPEAFRSISEVAATLGVRQHTLRGWETRFPFVKPVKRSDGRRYYRPSDIAVLTELKRLLKDGELSTEDILLIHRTRGLAPPPDASRIAMSRLRKRLAALTAARGRLTAILG